MSLNPQFGVMYHLTGFTADTWRGDFDALAAGGFHRLALWSLDNDAEVLSEALDLCEERSLQGCVVLFNPMAMASWWRQRGQEHPQHKCIGIDGQTLDFYNPFDPVAREEVLKPYLMHATYGIQNHPALSGWFIDDTLDAESMISYTPGDSERFRSYLQTRYENLDEVGRAWNQPLQSWDDIVAPRMVLPWSDDWQKMWDDWCKARQQWLIEWSKDVLSWLRSTGSAACILGDDWYSVRYGRDVAGGFTPKMARMFDSFSFDYTHAVHFLDTQMTNINRDIEMTRDLVGEMFTTMFLKAASAEDEPVPDMKQVIKQSELALKAGIDGLDYYIYRANPSNYAFKNCLANHPNAFRELSAFVRDVTA